MIRCSNAKNDICQLLFLPLKTSPATNNLSRLVHIIAGNMTSTLAVTNSQGPVELGAGHISCNTNIVLELHPSAKVDRKVPPPERRLAFGSYWPALAGPRYAFVVCCL